MALMVPNTEAETGKHVSSARKLMIAINRFDIFYSPEGTLVRFPFCLCQTAHRLKSWAKESAKEFATQPELWPLLEQALRQRQWTETKFSCSFSAYELCLRPGEDRDQCGKRNRQP